LFFLASGSVCGPHPVVRRQSRPHLGAADGGGKAAGKPRGGLEMIIAAVAGANDCVVVTYNEKDFVGVEIVNPMRGAI